MLKQTFKVFALSSLVVAFFSCDNSPKEETNNPPVKNDSTEIAVADSSPVVLEGITVIVHEHKFNDIPVTSHGKKLVENTSPTTIPSDGTKEKTSTELNDKPAALASNDSISHSSYDVHTLKQINAALLMAEYEANMEKYTVEEAIVPLEETQTIVAYNKKNEEEATLQIISVPGSEEIQQIIFTDKKHKDVYDVQAGMSGKEVKKLRKELKHMEHKGDHYLYDDQSNIMYLMHAENGYGDEINGVEIDQMEVAAIIWKDKTHHNKEEK